MKTCVLLLSLLAVALALDLEAPVINQAIIDQVNSNADSSWVAGVNERLLGMTVREFSRLLGVKKRDF